MTEHDLNNLTGKSTRREMLHKIARGVAMAGIAVTAIVLLNRKNAPAVDSPCPGGKCGDCSLLSYCNLPAANSQRQGGPK